MQHTPYAGHARPYLFEDETHTRLRESVRRFAQRAVAPHAHAWDVAEEFPRTLYGEAGRAEILGIGYSETYGGAGGDLTHLLAAGDEMILSGKSVGTAVGLGSHAIVLPLLLQFANEAQKQRYIPPVLRGEKIAALAVTEPDTGSDVANLRTRAERRGEHYIVRGAKTFITSGVRADFILCAVRTGDAGHGGISLLVIERGMSGFAPPNPLHKLGWCASDTAELFFDNCVVPASARIGDENAGFLMLMHNFATERLLLAGQAVAIAELAYREAKTYSQQRIAFGKPLTGWQVTRHKLADMQTRIAAARALTSEATVRHLRGEGEMAMFAMAKNAATDALMAVVDHAVQLHGGHGYMRGAVVERLYRDARLYPIGGGTREIMNEIIAKVEGY